MKASLNRLLRNAEGTRRQQRLGIAYYTSLALVLALTTGLSAWSIFRDYQNNAKENLRELSSLSRVLEGYSSALLQQSYESVRVSSAALTQSVDAPPQRQQVLGALREAMGYDPVSSVLFARLDGQVYAVDKHLQEVTDPALLQALRTLAGSPGDTLIQAPLLVDSQPTPLIPMLLGVSDRRGRAIQVGALIATTHFTRVLRQLGMAEAMNAGLITASGIVLYRTPYPERFIGRALPADSPVRPALSHKHAVVVDGLSIDGTRNRFALTPSARFPVFAVVGKTQDSLIAPWLRRSTYSLLLTGLSLVILGLAAYQLRRLFLRLSDHEYFYRRLISDIRDGILLLAADGQIRAANPVAARLFGVPAESLQGRLLGELSPQRQADDQLSLPRAEALHARTMAGEAQHLEWRFLRPHDQQPLDCDLHASPFRWQEQDLALVVLHDITERKRYLVEQEYLATHDPLTRLHNRYWLTRHIEQRIAQAPGQMFAVALLDMNRFKEVNDTLGHQHGDQILCELGQRLQGWLQEHDAAIARLGGDEMAFVSADLLDQIAINSLCHGVSQVLSHPLTADGVHLELTASIGVALYPEHGASASDLLRCADVAMYQAKRERREYVQYQRSADNYTPQRLALHAQLGKAIREDGLQLHYQPKVRLADNQVVGFEVLLRWPHPEKGMIAPNDFIPLAESTELIHPLTHWVLNAALRQLSDWQKQGLGTCLAINISTNNLLNPAFASELQQLLDRHQVAAELIELEVTEGALMEDPELAQRCLHAVRELGVHLSIDDFGTGYSSLSYLKQLPVQVLKIDRTFVSAMVHNASDAVIVQSTVALAHNFGMQVVAEGVEDEQTAAALARLDCDIAQGYHFGRPMPAEQVVTWRQQRQQASARQDV